MSENTQEKSRLCVSFVTKPSLNQAILTNIERFMEENGQTLLPPWLLLQRPRIKNVALFGNSYINVI